jgi:hypothetical protein
MKMQTEIKERERDRIEERGDLVGVRMKTQTQKVFAFFACWREWRCRFLSHLK